ncbi:hypothetical protein [Propionibacterium freudenreichii]|uniref:hypothetical protein n=1 Tax=Propionibacterium freudenreichii TaxID=1744 RepID=UPI00385306F7
MSGDASPELVALVKSTEVVRIRFTELTAVLDGDRGDLSKPQFRLGFARRVDQPREFGIRLRCWSESEDGTQLAATAAAEYQIIEETLDVPETPLLVEFANEVAIPMLVPYLREEITSLSSKVFGTGLLLPILTRGMLVFDPADFVATP